MNISIFLLVTVIRLELLVPHKKSVDRDPKVYAKLVSEDPRSHQGAFRAAHLVCIDDAMKFLEQNVSSFKHPLFIQQGGQDRVADTNIAYEYLTRTSTSKEDKKMIIYPVCQHVIYRKAKTEEEDKAGRIVVMRDNVEWMVMRCTPISSQNRGRAAEKQKLGMERSMSWKSDATLVEDQDSGNDSSSDTDVSESEQGSLFGSEAESEPDNDDFSFSRLTRRHRRHQSFNFPTIANSSEHNFSYTPESEMEPETPKFSAQFVNNPTSFSSRPSNLSKKSGLPSLFLEKNDSVQNNLSSIFSPSMLSPIPSPTPRANHFSSVIRKSPPKDFYSHANRPHSQSLSLLPQSQFANSNLSSSPTKLNLKSPLSSTKYHFNLAEIERVSYLDHHLTAKAHRSTLPKIHRDFSDKRIFRQKWSMHDALRPYELSLPVESD